MNQLALHAPAKINYRLDVLSRRPDGYHELRMIMQQISLCDDISLELCDQPGITVTCGTAGVPDGPDNIAWKAARAILDRSNEPVGVHIFITKRIPAAAGLGGGSSDAATVLMGMNQLLELGLSKQQLMEIGVTLGADVPFFIFGTTALAEGIGEKLSPLPPLPSAYVLLVNPGIPVSTAWVYRSLQLTNRPSPTIIPQLFGGIDDIIPLLSNDLETVTIPAFPVIADIKRRMMQHGAIGAMMSGSGPTVFGLFSCREQAEQARAAITTGTTWFSTVTETL